MIYYSEVTAQEEASAEQTMEGTLFVELGICLLPTSDHWNLPLAVL